MLIVGHISMKHMNMKDQEADGTIKLQPRGRLKTKVTVWEELVARVIFFKCMNQLLFSYY